MAPLTTDSIDSTHTHTRRQRRQQIHAFIYVCDRILGRKTTLPAAARQKCIKRRCGAQPKSEAKKDRDGDRDSDTVRGRKGERKSGRAGDSESEKGLSERAAAIRRLQGIPGKYPAQSTQLIAVTRPAPPPPPPSLITCNLCAIGALNSALGGFNCIFSLFNTYIYLSYFICSDCRRLFLFQRYKTTQ